MALSKVLFTQETEFRDVVSIFQDHQNMVRLHALTYRGSGQFRCAVTGDDGKHDAGFGVRLTDVDRQ